MHQMCQLEGFKFCWDIKNNGTFPVDLARLEQLSVIIINLQLMNNYKI
jgi:hypothetical protein